MMSSSTSHIVGDWRLGASFEPPTADVMPYPNTVLSSRMTYAFFVLKSRHA